VPGDDEIEVSSLREFRDWLDGLDDRVDAWLHDVVDEAVDYGGAQLVAHAPGSIKDLVGTDDPRPGDEGVLVHGEAYVIPAIDEKGDNDAKPGSNPEDYPYYVDVGTGIFGERGAPITAFPGGVMGPIEYGGRMIYLKSTKGQRAQLYSEAAADDVDAMLDFRIPAHSGKIVLGGR